jgi:hypothetical protein
MRHPLESDVEIGQLLALFLGRQDEQPGPPRQ